MRNRSADRKPLTSAMFSCSITLDFIDRDNRESIHGRRSVLRTPLHLAKKAEKKKAERNTPNWSDCFRPRKRSDLSDSARGGFGAEWKEARRKQLLLWAIKQYWKIHPSCFQSESPRRDIAVRVADSSLSKVDGLAGQVRR